MYSAKEDARAYAKKYYLAHRDYYNERNKNYYHLNRTAVLEKNKLWFQENKEKLNAYQRDRRKRNKTEQDKPTAKPKAKAKAKKGKVTPFEIIESSKTLYF
jgi:hypothetical protein